MDGNGGQPTRRRSNANGGSTAGTVGQGEQPGSESADNGGNLGGTNGGNGNGATGGSDGTQNGNQNGQRAAEENPPDSRLFSQTRVRTRSGRGGKKALEELTQEGAKRIFVCVTTVIQRLRGGPQRWATATDSELEGLADSLCAAVEPYPAVSRFLALYAGPFLVAGAGLMYFNNRMGPQPVVQPGAERNVTPIRRQPVQQPQAQQQQQPPPVQQAPPQQQANGTTGNMGNVQPPPGNYNHEPPLVSEMDN